MLTALVAWFAHLTPPRLADLLRRGHLVMWTPFYSAYFWLFRDLTV
ncbi:MAG: hypothetical protein ACT4NU_00280 [Chromatiales bacterium]